MLSIILPVSDANIQIVKKNKKVFHANRQNLQRQMTSSHTQINVTIKVSCWAKENLSLHSTDTY